MGVVIPLWVVTHLNKHRRELPISEGYTQRTHRVKGGVGPVQCGASGVQPVHAVHRTCSIVRARAHSTLQRILEPHTWKTFERVTHVDQHFVEVVTHMEKHL